MSQARHASLVRLGVLLVLTPFVAHCSGRGKVGADQTPQPGYGQPVQPQNGAVYQPPAGADQTQGAQGAQGAQGGQEERDFATGKINGDAATGGGTAPASSGGGGKINAGRGTTQPAEGGAPSEGGGSTPPPPAAAKCKPVPADYSIQKVDQWVAAHKQSKPGWKYVYVPVEDAKDPEMLQMLRVGVLKAWNHLSWKAEIDLGEDASDGHCLVRALNPAAIWDGEGNTNWNYLANGTAKQNIQISPAPRGLLQSFGTDATVPAPRFVFNATHGGPYANIHKTPPDYNSFVRKFPLGQIVATSAHKEAIVCGPRITAWYQVTVQGKPRYYAVSSDQFDGQHNSEIPQQYRTRAPTTQDRRYNGAFIWSGGQNTAVASEWWMQLPNGFLYWGIHGEGSQERGKAEFPFAIDPANWQQGYALATGRSCISCHVNGVHAAKTDEGQNGKGGWTSNETLETAFYKPVRDEFQAAMRKIVTEMSAGDQTMDDALIFGTKEPIRRAIRQIEGPFRGGGGGGCASFCQGKYASPPRGNGFCDQLPER